MAFTIAQLLLTDERQAQLTAALANTGEPDPLGMCINEALADVARLTSGYVIVQASLDGWTRSIALWKAYTIAELGVPDDIQNGYDAAITELQAIAEGKRPNLPKDTTQAANISAGFGASKCNIPGRMGRLP